MKRAYQNLRDLRDALPQDRSFTLVGGAFDLIHIGHVELFEQASTFEDMLVVCVLTDKSVRSYKGTRRPIVPQEQRLQMVASIRWVDFAYLSDTSPSTPETLSLLKPSSVVFGDEPGNEERITRWTERIKIHSPHTNIRLSTRNAEGRVSTSQIVRRIQILDKNI